MKISKNQGSILLIAAIIAIVATSLFLIVKITPLFIVAYIFILLGNVLFCFGNLYLLASKKSYPWFAAFPMTIWRYIISQLLLSGVFVIRENVFDASFPTIWFTLFHIVLLAFFLVLLTLQKAGKEIIEQREAVVKEKVMALRFMQADAESLVRKFPAYSGDLKKVAEALRYSDPMSHTMLAPYEEGIQRGLMAISGFDGEAAAQIPARCAELLQQIADRNMRVKMMK